LWTIEELGLPYERVDAGMQYGVVNTPEYRNMNPNGLVPTIDDDGFVLGSRTQSCATLPRSTENSGLRTRASAPRPNAGWTGRSRSRQRFRAVFWGLVRTPPEKRDAAAIEEGRKKSAELLGYFDAGLSRRKYVAGDAFTVGDIPLGCHVQLWMRLPIERPKHAALEGWFGRLLERPAYRKVVDIPLS
jgi:glutathione S-transferase